MPTDDVGMVSVEAAIATGSLVAVLALILAAMSALVLDLRCVDAAGEAARLASRDDVDAARRTAARLVPAGAEIVVETHGEDVTVRVAVAPLGSALPGLRVSAGATAAREADAVATAGPDPATPDPAVPDPAVPDPVAADSAAPAAVAPGVGEPVSIGRRPP